MRDHVLALGIHFGHDAAVSICSPDGVLFSLQEERVSRIKHHFGFPRRGVELALARYGALGRDIGIVAFSTTEVILPEHGRAWMVSAGSDRQPLDRTAADPRRIERVRDKVQRTWRVFAPRHWSMHVDFMRDAGMLRDEVTHYYVAHHRAHAASAFRLCGLGGEPVSVLTCDGKGDGLSATIYRGDVDGRLTYLRGSTPEHSLGMFYQAITETLGFVPVDGEYKTMGLAAFGEAKDRANPFAGLVSSHDGVLASQVAWKAAPYNDRHPDKRVDNPIGSVVHADEFARLLEAFSEADLAFFAQAQFEAVMLQLSRDAMDIAGSRHLAAAGGVLLNVKANALIRDELQPASFFVYPDSADSGLAAGAAMEALYQEGAVTAPAAFTDPYLGHDWDATSVAEAIARCQRTHPLIVTPATVHDVAKQIAGGTIVGSFQGRLECGPRALGNRSVLADPRRPEVKDKINLLLKGREPFVPFAPSILEEDAHLYWDGPIDYPFMTFAVSASEYAKQTVPAVVHVDGTLRPQVVTERRNRRYAELLRAFKELTGVGVLLNTSFNRHGHPIVGSPDDALLHLTNGWVEAVWIGDLLVHLPTNSVV
jgi:carbamoyltransferase